MHRILCTVFGKKSGSYQIVNSIVWAAIMIISALIVNDKQTNEFLAMLYIVGWFITTMPYQKSEKPND
jgi:hypothetical protein